MANLNLSEFGEKLFVTDADHTFIWDTANAISKRVSRNSWLNSGTLTSDAPVTISQTWNNAAVAFTGLKFNAAGTSDANSASGSLLADLQVGGVSKFSVRKDGRTTVGNVIVIGNSLFSWESPYLRTYSPFSCTKLDIGAVGTVLLEFDAANTLALRNSTAAQTFRVYNTYTDASNYERLDIGWTSNTLFIRNVKGGSGQNRDLVVTSGADMYLGSGNTDRWRIVNAGHFIGNVDNQYDIGASGANRPRNVYVGSNIYAAGNVGIGTTSPTSKLHVAETWNSPTIAVTSATGTGTIATVNFASSAVIPVGTRVTVAGVSPSQYNGTHVVTASSATSVSYASTVTTSATAGGTVQRVFAVMQAVATDIDSALESNLLEFWSGSTPTLKGYVAKTGSFVGGAVGANERAALSFPSNGSYSVGIYQPAAYKIQFSMTSGSPGQVAAAAYSGLQYEMTAGVLSWGTTAQDIVLLRDGEADHLALRRGALGQKFSVYGTYPNATAWERFTITAPTSGNVLLGTYKGTGGVARGLEFQTDGVTRMTLSTTGGLAFNNNGTTDASSGIGAWYLTTTGVQIANTASFRWNGDVGISRNASGVVEINSTTAGTYRDLRVRSVIQQPPATITPDTNGDLVVEATSNTTLTFKLKGTDGTVRTGTITLA